MSRPRLIIVAVCALLALPGPAAGAEPVDVTGVAVLPDDTPAAGIEVLVGLAGSDIVQPVTTDETGAFAVQVAAAVGDTIEVRATGATVRTGPDADGCIRSSTPTGRTAVTIETLPPDPIRVVLDTVVEDTVCTATAAPARTPTATPPATDARGRPVTGGAGWLAVLAVLSTVTLAAIRLTPGRRSSRSRG